MRKSIFLVPVLLLALVFGSQWGNLTGQFVADGRPTLSDVLPAPAPPVDTPPSFQKTLAITLTPTRPIHLQLLGPVSAPYAPVAHVDVECSQILDISIISDRDLNAWTEKGIHPPKKLFSSPAFAYHKDISLYESVYLLVEATDFPINDRADCTGSVTYTEE